MTRLSLIAWLTLCLCVHAASFNPSKRSTPSRRGTLEMCSTAKKESTAKVRTTITIAENRKANSEYEWEEKYEAGIALVGTEVKSCRKNTVQLSDGLAEVRDGEMWLLNVHMSEYGRCSMREQHFPKRARKLLLRHREILKLEQRVLQRNLEIIPIRLFFNEKSCVKVELGVGRKKSLNDKRDDIIKRDGDREVRRVMKSSSNYD
jgi:SsrA-binding protein